MKTTALTREYIVSSLTARASELGRHGVRRLGLFGSHARGDAGPDSDVDFIVEFDRKTFDRYMDVRFLLEDLFERRIDLVPIDRIRPALREAIDVPGL